MNLFNLKPFNLNYRCKLNKAKVSQRFLSSVLAVVFVFFTAAAQATVIDVTVTSPWLAMLVNFIGGVNVKVTSIQEWNDNGDLVKKIKPRSLQTMDSESFFMAFDLDEAQALGLPFDMYKNYRSLYKPFPIDINKIDVNMSDPSILPIIAQRVLVVLADWDPSSYPYYQRRLAEFQARLYSTTMAGRQILKDQSVYDLTGHSSMLLKAAGCKLIRPTDEEWAAWSSWKDVNSLVQQAQKNAESNVVVVVDMSTPKAIRSAISSIQGVFVFVRPRLEQDYPSFMHDQYISLWLKLTSKPLPVPPKKIK